jgi:hypothetical protein
MTIGSGIYFAGRSYSSFSVMKKIGGAGGGEIGVPGENAGGCIDD